MSSSLEAESLCKGGYKPRKAELLHLVTHGSAQPQSVSLSGLASASQRGILSCVGDKAVQDRVQQVLQPAMASLNLGFLGFGPQ